MPTPEREVESSPTPENSGDDAGPDGNARAALPSPTLFDVGWEETELFHPAVIGEAADALDALQGASVYHMDITIEEGYTGLSAREGVLYTNREEVALDDIFFRLYPNLLGGTLELTSLLVNGAPVQGVLELNNSALRVPMEPSLEPGQSVVLALEFTVDVPTTSEGNYGSFVFRDDVLALAHFYPLIAVYDDEGWNVEIPAEGGDIVYADSSFYLVRVHAPAAAVVIASGTTIDERTEGSQQILTVAAAPVRDFYLVASERFDVVSERVGESTINSYAFPEQMEVAQDSLDVAIAAFESFNRRFGTYPFTEFDIVPTPNLALGIEYPGVVVITDRLYQPGGLGANTPTGIVLESTVAHEVGHQWFYSVVGNDQLDEPWLDEALVQYITYLYFLDAQGMGAATGFLQSLEGRWDRVDNAEVPIGLPVAAYSGLEYGAIVYGRGPLFFYALEQEMGQEAFDNFLREYYQQNRFGIGTGDAMKRIAEAQCSCDLAPLWETWVEGQ